MKIPLLPSARSLSARLLVLTILFVMLSEVFIYAPSIARFRESYMLTVVGDAHLATLALEATPDQMVSEELRKDLLEFSGTHAIVTLQKNQKRTLTGDMPPPADAAYDLRDASFLSLIYDAFIALSQDRNRVLRVIAQSPKRDDTMIEVFVDEQPMRNAMVAYSNRILLLSVMISLFTAALVFFTLRWLMVRPMRQMTENMISFRADPENVRNLIVPSDRRDEIGIAERELHAMQEGLRAALHQRRHLAALGEAVTKINHDLRNMLASAQLISDRLVASDDPATRKLAPTLVRSIDRAVNLCMQTLEFARDGTTQLALERVALAPLIEDVFAALASDPQAAGLSHAIDGAAAVRADREQLFRVFNNVVRNAMQAGAKSVALRAQASDETVAIDVEDDGPGLPEQVRGELFHPFVGTSKKGGTGLGLAIAHDILRQHGGDIRLIATGPAGTHFRVELPRA
ncbi:MAG: PAS domain-containing sensor histidine kinase [Alphaproteobacteria bacterium]